MKKSVIVVELEHDRSLLCLAKRADLPRLFRGRFVSAVRAFPFDRGRAAVQLALRKLIVKIGEQFVVAGLHLDYVFEKPRDILEPFFARYFRKLGVDPRCFFVFVLCRKFQVFDKVPFFLKRVFRAYLHRIYRRILVCRLNERVEHSGVVEFLIGYLLYDLCHFRVAFLLCAVYDIVVTRLCHTFSRKSAGKIFKSFAVFELHNYLREMSIDKIVRAIHFDGNICFEGAIFTILTDTTILIVEIL